MIHKSTETIVFFAGSFNPFTKGHLNIAERCAALFTKVIIGVGANSNKDLNRDSVDMRLQEIAKATGHIDNIEVIFFDCLTVEAAKNVGATLLVRGVRDVADFEYERRMAEVNRKISGLETLLMFAQPELAAVSSSVVRELNRFGFDTKSFLP